jgi:hypothetical protein
VDGQEAGKGTLYKLQQYIGTEVNFASLFIGAPLGTEVRAPEDGILVSFSICTLNSLTSSNSFGGDADNFDAFRVSVLQRGDLPVSPDYSWKSSLTVLPK